MEVQRGDAAGQAAVEVFARDVLQLVRAVRLYPADHPSISIVASRLISSIPDRTETWVIGVSRTELQVSGAFCGKPGSKVSELARLLYERRVLRLMWKRGTLLTDVLQFARLLADHAIQGAELNRQLELTGVIGIRIEPLDLARLHEAFRAGVSPDTVVQTSDERHRDVWLWLQRPDVDPEALASALLTSDLWEQLSATAAARGSGASAVASLAAVVDRIETAVGLLPEDQRETVFSRLADLGTHLPSEDLAALVDRAPDSERQWGRGTVAVLRDISPDRFIDLLAHLASASGRATRRLADVFRRFSPAGGTLDALARVQSRLAAGDSAGFARNVWQTVEDLLLRLEEDPFMVADYTASLEAMVDLEPGTRDHHEGFDLWESVEPHLDEVHLGLAAEGGADARRWLIDRVRDRGIQSQPLAALHLAHQVDTALPGLLDEVPEVVEAIMRAVFVRDRTPSQAETRTLRDFCRRHEVVTVAPLLDLLGRDQRMWSRRLVVDILSACSPVCTPVLVARARSSPWYVTRNLAIVLGRCGDPRAVRALQEFVDHPHAKVRREAVRALAAMDLPQAWEYLGQVAASIDRDRADRELAAALFSAPVQKRDSW